MEYCLQVGEAATVFPPWWGKSWTVIHAGAVSDDVVSVAVQGSMGHNSAAYNLFLGRDTDGFALPVGRVRVVSLSPSEIRLRFERAV